MENDSVRSKLGRFQSIGVTKDWRRRNFDLLAPLDSYDSFQSIGVTKDWRPHDT